MKRIFSILLGIAMMLTVCPVLALSDGAEPYIAGDTLPAVRNADGVELRVGMSRSEYEEYYGQSLDNGWSTTCTEIGVTALSLDNVIVMLSPRDKWTLDNGVEIGMPFDEVRQLLGEGSIDVPEIFEGTYVAYENRLFYTYDDGGVLVLDSYPFDTDIAKANCVTNISLASAQYDKGQVLGIIYRDIIGEGDALLEDILVSSFVEYSFENDDGNLEVYLEYDYEKMVCSIEGKSSGFAKPDFYTTGRFRVESDGKWRIIVKSPSDAFIPPPFIDVDVTDPAFSDIYFLYSRGIMAGESDRIFSRYGVLTRSALAEILYALAKKPQISDPMVFSDVSGSGAFADAVAWAAQSGIVNGVGDNRFDPGGPVTREQFAVMLYRFYGGTDTDASRLTSLTDGDNISLWAQSAVSWALEEGILEADSTSAFLPGEALLRIECAQALATFLLLP